MNESTVFFSNKLFQVKTGLGEAMSGLGDEVLEEIKEYKKAGE